MKFGLIVFCLNAVVQAADDIKIVNLAGAVKEEIEPSRARGHYIPLPQIDSTWAISGNGTVLHIGRESNEAILFPNLSAGGNLEGAIHQTVGDSPISVVWKKWKEQGYFLVACSKSICVLSDKDGSVVKSIPVTGSTLQSVTAPSDANVPIVYYTTGENSGDSTVGLINLETLTDDGLIDMTDNAVYEITPSADGSMLYARRPGSSPAGFYAFAVQPGTTADARPRASKTTYEHETCPGFFVDPFNQLVACDQQLYSRDLSHTDVTLPAKPVAYSLAYPLVIGTDESDLVAMSTNTNAIFGKVHLPAPAAPDPAMPNHRRPTHGETFQQRILIDDAHKNVLACGSKSVAIIPFSAFGIVAEPVLSCHVQGLTRLAVGSPWSAKILAHDPSTTVSLVSGPAGLKLDNNTLSWTPPSSAVGIVDVSLSLSEGAVKRTQTVSLEVARSGMVLPFFPDQLAISDSGKLALILRSGNGGNGQYRPRRQRGVGTEDSSPRVALIDLAKLCVVADRTLTTPIRAAAVDDHYAYIGMQDSTLMVALSLKDLSDAKRIFTDSFAWKIESAGNRLYVGVEGKPNIWLTLPSLELGSPSVTGQNYYGQTEPLPIKLHDDWYDAGAIYSSDFTQVHRIVQDDLLPAIAQANNQMAPGFDPSAAPVAPWDVRVNGNNLVRVTGQTIAAAGPPNSGQLILLNEVPAAAVIRDAASGHEGVDDHQRVEVALIDLVSGNELEPITILNKPRSPGGNGRVGLPHIAAANDIIVAQVDEQLFVLHTNDFAIGSLSTPLQVLPPANAVAIPGDQPSTFAYGHTGGKAPVEFSLAVENPGIAIDHATGVLSIDPQPLLNRSTDAVLQFVQNHSRYDPGTNTQRSIQDMIANYRKTAGAHFAAMTGHPAKGLPLALPLTVIARDSELQTVRMTQVFLVDAPASMLDSRVAEMQKNQAAQQAAMADRMAQFRSPTTASSSDASQLRHRIADLESQNQKLQAKIETLSDLLVREHGAAPATRP